MISTLYIDHQLTCSLNIGIRCPVVCVIYIHDLPSRLSSLFFFLYFKILKKCHQHAYLYRVAGQLYFKQIKHPKCQRDQKCQTLKTRFNISCVGYLMKNFSSDCLTFKEVHLLKNTVSTLVVLWTSIYATVYYKYVPNQDNLLCSVPPVYLRQTQPQVLL